MATLFMLASGSSAIIDRTMLHNIPVFGGLSDEQLDWILAAGTIGEVAAGQQLVSEGEPASSVFVVCVGELEVCKRGGHGAEVRLAVLRAGDCVGEMSLIDIQPRSATVRALTPAVLFRLGHSEIAKLYGKHPEVYMMLVLNIAREISRRLRVADQKLAEMGVPVGEMWQTERPRPPS
jgi:CRP/FNR family transcriptional regulator, cyclic AMP receptor protein